MTLHDINPPIEMINDSFLYLLGFILFGVITLLWVYIHRKNKKGDTKPIHILEHCDYQDAKKTALQFSYYGKKLFTSDSEKALFLTLQAQLERYKYIPRTTPLPQELKADIQALLKQTNARHA